MRSNTLTPLFQFTEWFGLNGFKANGINYPKRNKSSNCECLFQHPWQGSTWSRDDLIAMLQNAEDLFVSQTGFHIAPHQITEERHEYPLGIGSPSMLNKNGQYKSVQPDFSCKIKTFGTIRLDYYGLTELEREGEDGIYDVFYGSFIPVEDIDISSYHLYFTEIDASYYGALAYNEARIYEIRPVVFKQDGDLIRFEAPAFLFKKPELDENDSCLEHELETYVSEVAIYYEQIDNCSQGRFVYNAENVPCSTPNCQESYSNLCVQKRLIGDQTWASPIPANCSVVDDELVYVNYRLHHYPIGVDLNYLTGEKLTKNNRVNNQYFNTIAKLAVGLADCVRKWCECDECATNKLNHYREILKTKVEDADPTMRAVGDRYQIILTPQSMALIGGFPPYLGLIQAFQEMAKYYCKTVEGGTI